MDLYAKKEEIQNLLRQGECEVVFTKANGDERQMVCTLHPDFLPYVDHDAPKGQSNETDEAVTVWDVEAQGWRKFRIDSLIEGPVVVS